MINCDFQGPLLKDDIEIIVIEQVRNVREKFKTFDVSNFFKPVYSECFINGYKISKVTNALTGDIESLDYVSIDEDGLLRIANFETEIEPS